MSKTNKTSASTEEVNTAPYLKKKDTAESADESSKSNIIIPAVLLLVSAIVIGATFYEDEYKQLFTAGFEATQGEETVALDSNVQETATQDVATTEPAEINTAPEQNVVAEETEAPAKVEQLTAAPIAAQATSKPAAIPSSATLAENDATAAKSPQNTAGYNRVRMQRVNITPTQRAENRQQAREQAMQRAQAQAKKHNEMMQQRRQAYEQEMQARRDQYNARMQAQQEQRSKIAETQKAIFQRVQQNRVDTAQKLKEMHKQISKMHEELHQIMRQPYTPAESSAEHI